GERLLLAVAQREGLQRQWTTLRPRVDALLTLAATEFKPGEASSDGTDYLAIGLLGDRAGITWQVDDSDRLIIEIPAGENERLLQVVRQTGRGQPPTDLAAKVAANDRSVPDPTALLA